jgi:biopolymer transport protein ExbD
MLNSTKALSHSPLASALEGSGMLRPSQKRGRRAGVAGLMLTSLVDAFSILVIFLIMNNATSSESLNIGKNVQLPTVSEGALIQEGVTVRIEDGKFFVEDKVVDKGSLISTLKSFNENATVAKKEGIIIVADKALDYEDLNPVILAGSQAGFTKFKFAVIKK